MIGRTNSSSMNSTTDALDFTVVDGLTEPANPKEKMIWIATDEEITSWTFSVTEPAAQQGLVWFQTGLNSQVAFSVTKDNPIMVYPIRAYQYINNSWTEKVTKIYLNDGWVTWYTTTYWFKSTEGPTNTWQRWSNTQQSWAGIFITTDRIALVHDGIGASGSQESYTRVASTSTINLNNINTLYFEVARELGESYSAASAAFGIATSFGDYLGPNFVASKQVITNNRTIYEIDVSQLTGDYYLAISASGYGGGAILIYNIYGS